MKNQSATIGGVSLIGVVYKEKENSRGIIEWQSADINCTVNCGSEVDNDKTVKSWNNRTTSCSVQIKVP